MAREIKKPSEGIPLREVKAWIELNHGSSHNVIVPRWPPTRPHGQLNRVWAVRG